jgi:hypothetical protein
VVWPGSHAGLLFSGQISSEDRHTRRGGAGVMDPSSLKPSIQALDCDSKELASLVQRDHHAAANRTASIPVANDKKRL